MSPLHIAILAFDGMEALDFAGPFEVLTTVARVHQKMFPGAPAWSEVRSVAAAPDAVVARAGLRVLPDIGFDSALQWGVDLLVIPGGVVDVPRHSPATLQWIRDTAGSAKITASVCTGAFLLAASGVIQNERVTTHWEDVADLRAQYPALQVQTGVRWVDTGQVVTSAGISAGIDMSLHLVERLGTKELAVQTARQMDFAWTRN
jgi:transcriptional regulator GlxA family with amidase domain